VKIEKYNSLGGCGLIPGLHAFGAKLDYGEIDSSGFLGGVLRGGPHVCELEEEWCWKFGSKHAIACNSATSGLMAAVEAARIKRGMDRMLVSVPAFTMSATAAAPSVLGHAIYFEDCEDETFCVAEHSRNADVFIITNLFGCPAPLHEFRKLADLNGQIMIEDNAQAILAKENGKYAGTIGHIGVFSLNVHKHIQAGEGGVCVTDDDDLALYMRMFINHAEMFENSAMIGLNLRMTEITAFVALQQLGRVDELVRGRQEKAVLLLEAIGEVPGVRMPVQRENCDHACYAIPFLVERDRRKFVKAMREKRIPLVEGYVNPLNRMPAFTKWACECPVAEDLHDRRLFYWENCAWDPTEEQIKEIGKTFRKVAREVLT